MQSSAKSVRYLDEEELEKRGDWLSSVSIAIMRKMIHH